MKKLNEQRGFTLVEMLACVVALLLIGMIVTTGMNLANKSLAETMFESNSQMLENTLNMYIGDILRHATDVKEKNGNIEFCNDAYYIEDGYLFIDTEGSKMENAGYLSCTSKLYEEDVEAENPIVGTLVANKGIYAENLYIRDFYLDFDADKGIFTGGYTIVSLATERTKTCEFSYRTIAMN